jgi:hypothetical protein
MPSNNGTGAPVSWGFKEFLQVAGLTIGSGLLSMYVTQKTILLELTNLSQSVDSSISEMKYRADKEVEYLEYKIETYKDGHEAECREIRRRVNILELRAGIAGPVIGDNQNGRPDP